MTSGALVGTSYLFVPGDRPDRFAKAQASGADSIIIDLEDAVAPAHKAQALRNATAWLADGHAAVVRVNGVGTVWHDEELAALAATSAVVMVPKAQSVADLEVLQDLLGERIIALVETARGVRDVDEVASLPGVVRLALGNVDLSAELGVDPASHPAMAHARGRLVMASAAAGIAPPIDGVTTALDDPDALAADLAHARELGFGAKLCIHPRQPAAVNAAMRPSPADLAWARRVLAAETSEGVGVVDGTMVDAPVRRRAERIIAADGPAR